MAGSAGNSGIPAFCSNSPLPRKPVLPEPHFVMPLFRNSAAIHHGQECWSGKQARNYRYSGIPAFRYPGIPALSASWHPGIPQQLVTGGDAINQRIFPICQIFFAESAQNQKVMLCARAGPTVPRPPPKLALTLPWKGGLSSREPRNPEKGEILGKWGFLCASSKLPEC